MLLLDCILCTCFLQGLAEMIEHGEAMKLFVGDPGMDEVESFCSEEISPPPQVRRHRLTQSMLLNKASVGSTVYISQ